jgi:hypothetical protein
LDGGVGVFAQPQPGSIPDEKFLTSRDGNPFIGQEKPKEGVPGATVGGKGRVGQSRLYTQGSDQSQLILSFSNVWMW